MLLVCCAVSLAACSNTSGSNAGGVPFFMLKVLPDEVSLPNQGEKVQRINPSFTDTLVPSDEYGKLIPYIGGYYQYKSTGVGESKVLYAPVYGLSTADGRTVTDPVYDSVRIYAMSGTGYIYELVTGSDGSEPSLGRHWLASEDGTWIFEIPTGSRLTDNIGGGMVMLERIRTVRKKTFVYQDFYDYSGNFVFTFDKAMAEDENTSYTIGRFADGLAPVNTVVAEPAEDSEEAEPEKTVSAFYIDVSGKKTYEGFIYCGEFHGGYAVVADKDGKYGVINTNGEYLINPEYRAINYNYEKGYFACGAQGYFDILDMTGVQVKRVLCDRGNVEVLGFDTMIYKRTNSSTGRSEYFYADTDVPFTCEETGQFPDETGNLGGLYVCSYSGSANIFDESGKTVTVLDDFGSLVCKYGDYIMAVNSNGTKTAVISLGSGKATGWINMSFEDRQAFADRYIVLKSQSKDKPVYSLYDIETGTFVYENCDRIETAVTASDEYLLVLKDGKTAVYDMKFNTVIMYEFNNLG